MERGGVRAGWRGAVLTRLQAAGWRAVGMVRGAEAAIARMAGGRDTRLAGAHSAAWASVLRSAVALRALEVCAGLCRPSSSVLRVRSAYTSTSYLQCLYTAVRGEAWEVVRHFLFTVCDSTSHVVCRTRLLFSTLVIDSHPCWCCSARMQNAGRDINLLCLVPPRIHVHWLIPSPGQAAFAAASISKNPTAMR